MVEVSLGAEREAVSYGRWVDGAPPSANSVFYAASLTKQLMGTMTAIASDEDELRTDDSVRHWLPELPRWTQGATIAQLLHHLAGLPRELPSLNSARSTSTVLAAVETLIEPANPPGARFEYSNDGYVLIAAILERAAGIPIERLAAKRVFTPLGMKNSLLSTRPRISIAGEPNPPATIGDGGWWTTAADVGRLLRHLNHDAHGKRLMETGQLIGGEDIDYGWGVRVLHIDGLLAASHGGSWARWQSKTLRIPERDCAIVVVARTDHAQTVSDLATELAATFSQAW